MYFNTSKTYWQYLRRMRSSPPPAVLGNDARRGTFNAALEQSEQLYTAATSVGMESKPILLYYGIYQAGRAIAAANPDRSCPWQLQGHGLKAPNLSDRDRAPVRERQSLTDMVVRGTGRIQEAYPTIARILNSPDLTTEIKLGSLFALLDETRTRTYSGGSSMFASLNDMPAPLAVSVEAFATRNGIDVLCINGLPASILQAQNMQALVGEFLRRFYPQFNDQWEVGNIDNGSGLGRKGWLTLTRQGEITVKDSDYFTPADEDRSALERELGVRKPYFSFDDVVDPTLPEQGRTLHRLCAWWAALFYLSMTARYAPNAWTDDLNVDMSPHAVGLEQLLEFALEEVPCLVGEVIESLAN
ncbi:YaaC family protein [Saccharothrix hoggarensis]|uniref:YaaC family protein n=1 Tax=Saccharothrix hoggarensis TaxID=913853 RepID=A0ABW3QST0_9PSEU